MKGILLPNKEQMCIQMFVDDTNAIVANEEQSLQCFLECLTIYYKASRPKINHTKTEIKSLIEEAPD